MEDSQTRISFYKKRVGIASLLLLTIGLVSGLILVRQVQDVREEAAPLPVKLYFIQDSLTVDSGSKGNIYDIYLDAGGNYVTAVDLEIGYDTSFITASNLVNSWIVQVDDSGTTGPSQVLLHQKFAAGTRRIVLGIRNPNYTSSGAAVKIASFVFDAPDVEQSTTIPIEITTKTQVAAKGFTNNVLGTTSNGEIIIELAGVSPTPTSPPPACLIDGECKVTGQICCNNNSYTDYTCGSGTRCGRVPTPTQPPAPTSTPTPTPTGPPPACLDDGQCTVNGKVCCSNFTHSDYTCSSGTRCGREPTPTPFPTVTTCTQTNGDANKDGVANGNDFTAWLRNFSENPLANGPDTSKGDFNCDGYVNGNDFTRWLRYFTP